MRVRLVGLLVMLALTLGAQSVQECFSRDPGPLDFVRGEGHEQFLMQALCGDTLLGFDTSCRVVPRLARAWHQTKGTLRLDLRTDARFSDGTPVSAEDALWTIQEIQKRNDASPTKRAILTGVSAKALSGTTLELRSSKAPSRLLAELARIHVAKKGHPDLGSGPYGLERKQGAWIFRARTHFLKPTIPEFNFRLIQEEQAILQNLRKGWLTLGMAPSRRGLEPPAGYEVVRQATQVQCLIWSRLGPGPLKCIEGWRSEALNAEMFGGRAAPSQGLWPEGLGFTPMKMTCAKPDARGQRWEVLFTAGDETVQKALMLLRERARKDGVDLDLRPIEAALLYERLLKGDFALACAPNIYDPHPWTVLDLMEPTGALNFTAWKHPRLAALLPTLKTPESHAWQDLQTLWAEAPGALPILDLYSILWVDHRLKIAPSPMGLYIPTPGAAGWRWVP